MVRKTLNVGDYTTEKLLKFFVIERKSPTDLYSTLLKGHKRFKKELQRAEKSDIQLVIYVECSRKSFLEKDYPGSEYQEYSSDTLEKIIRTMKLRYDLEIVWCRSRESMEKSIYNRLKKEEHELHNNRRR